MLNFVAGIEEKTSGRITRGSFEDFNELLTEAIESIEVEIFVAVDEVDGEVVDTVVDEAQDSERIECVVVVSVSELAVCLGDISHSTL
jgi:hypothetical protein